MTANDAESTPVIIDVEASGFGAGSYPIEVGVALPDGTTRCYLIRPADDWQHWDPAAEDVHRIPRPILLSRGRPLEDVARELNRELQGRTVYSDAWGYDSSWLARLFDAAEMPQRFRLEALRALLSEPQMACWDDARIEVQRALGSVRHRASADALVIQKTFLASRDGAAAAGRHTHAARC